MNVTKIFSVYLFILILLFTSCKTERLYTEVPPCIEKEIIELKTKRISNPPAEIWKWEVDGAEYYYFTSACCDAYNYLYDETCNKVCAPDGGITGKGDGSCPEFDENTIKTLVWKDDRN